MKPLVPLLPRPTVLLVALILAPAAPAQEPTVAPAPAPAIAAADDDATRAATFVQAMRFSDADKTERVTHLTASYLRQVRHVLNQRQATLDRLGEAGETPEIDLQTTAAWRIARDLSLALRDAYVVQLNALMTPAQVDRVKDGITRDAFHHTLQIYDEMVPELTHAQRAHIVGLLLEMRENAMLEVDPGPQRKWVEKYRGIVNNYIAGQGYDFAALSRAYEARHAIEE